MSTENLIQWLAEGPFFLFAIIIGVVVSFDVFVVEFTRDYEVEENGANKGVWTKRMQEMALWHASFHAMSFYLYTMIIFAFQFIVFLPIELFDLPEGVGTGLLVFINFIVICFIWWTYKSKIKEDHSEKSDDSKVVDRSDMKLLVDFVRALSYKYNFNEQARGVAVAGSVAIDMLAISALLKLYLLPNGDNPAISQFFGNVFIDVFVFAVTIFMVVGILVFIAQAASHFVRNSFRVVVFLRLAEPLAVFFILAGTVRALMQLGLGNYGGEINHYGLIYDLVFSLVVVASLLLANGISWNDLSEIYKRKSYDSKSSNPPITTEQVFSDLKALLPVLYVTIAIFGCVLLALGYAYSTEPGRNTHNHLIEATGYFAGAVLVLTIIFLYLPSRRFDALETKDSSNFVEIVAGKPFEFWSGLAGVTLALLALNLFNLVIFDRSFEVDSIILWSGYLVLSWLLFNSRQWRFFKVDAYTGGNGRRANDADYAELITAVGLASSVVVLFVPFVVTRLIA